MTATLLRWGRLAVAALLLASLVPQALALVRHLQPTTPAPGLAPVAVTDPAPSDTGIILQAAPFGRPAPVQDAVPEAAADLVLLGITVAADPAESRAIIAGGNAGAVASYRIGDEVAGGVALAAIADNAVELDNGASLAFAEAAGAVPKAAPAPSTGLIDFSGGAVPPVEGTP